MWERSGRLFLRQSIHAWRKVWAAYQEQAAPSCETESRHSILQHFAARAEQRSRGIELASKRDEIALVSASAVQKQQRAIGAARNELVNKVRLRPHDLRGTWIGGRIASICERADSIHGGRRRCLRSSSSFSSKVKPGGTVAISNSTPPGSRK